MRSKLGEYVLVVATLLVGICASSLLAWLQQEGAERRVRQNFEITAHDRIEVISGTLQNAASLGRSVSSFYQASQTISPHEFDIFTQQLLIDHPYIRAIEWVPYIRNEEERTELEEKMRLTNPSFTITMQDAQGTFSPLPANFQEQYFPITFIAPQQGNAPLLGFDISTNAARAEALHKAKHSNNVSMSGKVEVLQDLSRKPAVILITPVSKAHDAIEDGKPITYQKLEGFIAILLPLAEMIEQSIRPLNTAGVNLVIHDVNASEGRSKPLYIRASRLVQASESEILRASLKDQPLKITSTINVANRPWEITITPSKGYYRLMTDSGVWLALIGGSLFTALVAFYMLQRIRERDKISRVVIERTQQLQKAKHQTDLILRSTHEGIVGVDTNGRITFCNPMASNLLGYSKREMIGELQHTLCHHSHVDGSPYDADQCPIQQAIKDGSSINVTDEVFWKKDGAAMPVEYTAAPIRDDGDIEGGVIIFRDVTERRQQDEKLHHMARYDMLTGLANRSLFFELLRKAVQRTVRGNHRIAVIYMDLNGFKPVNDTLGHAAGDMLLKMFAKRIEAPLREYDTLARVGGDEFTILADNLAGRKECEVLIERLREALTEPFVVDETSFDIGASIGVALYPHDSKDMDTLISYADKAMYHAKANKNLPYVFYEDLSEEDVATDAASE
ncbi:MAG: diguanylate cyclase [Alphaproteobacteria bacterium]|nr:diguanylate cyclase [Alphaproteobacteria bacterium]